jgi:single-stranded-DNA-specific exonuclease
MLAGFLDPKLKDLLPDPSLLANMDAASARIADAIIAGEKIAILGDYDVDGACSSALLLGFLRDLGADPILYIPDRITEGYGPSEKAMSHLAGEDVKLVVTVDCGAGAVAALATAKELGLDVIVLDHHAVETDPPAYAHVNPNGPSDNSGLHQLCAAAVTFLGIVGVTRALRKHDWFGKAGIREPDLMDAIDLVGLATVADVVPLTGANRALVRQGLRKCDTLKRQGLAALAEVAGATSPFGVYEMGFVFGPRINAGGRVGKCDLGARLLSSCDATEAVQLARELDLHNRERKAIEQAILERAVEMAEEQAAEPHIFLCGEGWHPGVIGIVASRIKDKFRKPVLVAGFMSEKDDFARGSARSVPGVDIGAVIRAARENGLLSAGGGHAMAAGFTLARAEVDGFRVYLRTALESKRAEIMSSDDLVADGILSIGGATLEFVEELQRAGPFGPGNPEPVFIIPDVTVAYASVVGENHVRLRLGANGAMLDAISFRTADSPLGIGLLNARGARIHAAGVLRQNDYKGRRSIQLLLEDAALVATN